jgi:hypothetical protein
MIHAFGEGRRLCRSRKLTMTKTARNDADHDVTFMIGAQI